MEDALREIIEALRSGTDVDAVWLDKLVRRHNRAAHDGQRTVAKRRLLPFYLKLKREDPEKLASWGVNTDIDARLVRLLQAKPRRTASGVATITVLTKPWPCSSACVYCPNDIRMPKSYLADEPACQRAERCWFDPYLQVEARLRVLSDMGHITDKVELIVLGGTWSDYPDDYQRWFIGELFAALNDDDIVRAQKAAARREYYEHLGLSREPGKLACSVCEVQQQINAGELTYNEAWPLVYGDAPHRNLDECIRENAAAFGSASFSGAPHPVSESDIDALQRVNETAESRVVGLVVETRPDLITPESCLELRALGCTKVQMGVQSLRDDVLLANGRAVTRERITRAFELLRLFGFKSHVHFMVNLIGATPEDDIADYHELTHNPAFLPDELKLYPCALVESARLTDNYADGSWCPYTEEELLEVLCADVASTPPYTRISRMIRDISATDILAGNKKTNLRQMVEKRMVEEGEAVQEIRQREISVEGSSEALELETIVYQTTVSEEHFLQWVTPAGRIAGFLRLSLPSDAALRQLAEPPLQPGTAMIREVHVYGKVAALHTAGTSAQHTGLGRALVQEACHQAKTAGYEAVNVISAIGTREYYRRLGFCDNGLYQRRSLCDNDAPANKDRPQ